MGSESYNTSLLPTQATGDDETEVLTLRVGTFSLVRPAFAHGKMQRKRSRYGTCTQVRKPLDTFVASFGACAGCKTPK